MKTTTQRALQAYLDVIECRVRYYSKAAKIHNIDRKLVSYLCSIVKRMSASEKDTLFNIIDEDRFLYFSNREKTKSLEVAAKLISEGYTLIDSHSDEVTAVYILKSDIYYKIGVSSVITKRIGMLQTGNPHTIELICQKYFTYSVDAYKEEKRLHLKYSDKQVRREWFKLSKQDVEDILGEYNGK